MRVKVFEPAPARQLPTKLHAALLTHRPPIPDLCSYHFEEALDMNKQYVLFEVRGCFEAFVAASYTRLLSLSVSCIPRSGVKDG